MLYFTSDLHLGHDRGWIYGPRGFKNLKDMQDAIVARWNAVVGKDDEVWVLGDLMLCESLEKESIDILNSLNGEIKIILGNHDTDRRVDVYKLLPNVSLVSNAERIKWGGYHFYLSHFPTHTGSLEAGDLKKTLINLHGHTHSKTKFFQDIPYIYNVALDAHNCTPVSVQQVIEDCENKVLECKNLL